MIAGPTASGKTDAAVALALSLKTVVISADARQVYKEMQIGTARPQLTELQNVPHFLLGHRSIHETYDVADYEAEALGLLRQLFSSYEQVIVAGGSGLYMKALAYGLDDIPELDPEIRNQLNDELVNQGLDALVAELIKKDPEYAQNADLKNPRRVQRALEVIRSTGKPFSSFRTGSKSKRDFEMIWIGLSPERATLYEKINQRVDRMLAAGLMEEVSSLYPYRHLPALKTVGYTELFEVLDGHTSMDEAVELIKQNTRRYAKRQLTWFRRQHELEWMQDFDLDRCLRILRP